jgi:hypothetical protein
MHLVIDILAAIILLFFFLSGWHRGTLLSSLGVVRVVLSYGAAYFSGRYLGYWLGELAHRPRIMTIPVVAALTFILISFIFHVVMTEVRDSHKEKEKEENFQLPIYSSLCGSAINLFAGTLSLILLFWLGDLFMVGMAGRPLPGMSQAHFGKFVRRSVYEATYRLVPKNNNASQVAAIARMASNPARGLEHLESVLAADSVQQLLKDKTFAKDLLSGDADRLQQNASLQQLFSDRSTLDDLRELGMVSPRESRSGLCRKLSGFGRNETIQNSLQNLKAKDLLRTDRITQLIRDPDFDAIVAELAK